MYGYMYTYMCRCQMYFDRLYMCVDTVPVHVCRIHVYMCVLYMYMCMYHTRRFDVARTSGSRAGSPPNDPNDPDNDYKRQKFLERNRYYLISDAIKCAHTLKA